MTGACPVCPLRGDPEALACYFQQPDGSCEGPHSTAGGHAPPSRPPSDLDLRVAMEAETCPNGSGECGCGRKPRTCGRDGRPAETFRPACLACAARDWWEAGVEAGW